MGIEVGDIMEVTHTFPVGRIVFRDKNYPIKTSPDKDYYRVVAIDEARNVLHAERVGLF